jgi:hypothetical protein
VSWGEHKWVRFKPTRIKEETLLWTESHIYGLMLYHISNVKLAWYTNTELTCFHSVLAAQVRSTTTWKSE